VFLQPGIADILAIYHRKEQLIGFVNLCFYKQGLQILSLFPIDKCVFSVFCGILDPQLEHRVCKVVLLQTKLADLLAICEQLN